MAKIWYGHFDSTPEDERILLAEDWAKYIRAFITDGIRNGGTCLQVTAGGGMSVKIDTGIANIQGYVMYVEADNNGTYYEVPIIAANHSLPRIDRLILRLDRTIQNRAIVPMVLLGTASANPVPPALTRNNNIWEMSLAQIHLNAGALQVYDNNIIDERFDNETCGLMHSILGLDSGVWQNAFNAFMAAIDSAFANAQSERATAFTDAQSKRNADFQQQMSEQQSNWRSQTNTQKAVFTTQMNGIQSELATAAGFDFWNAARMPGSYYKTEYPENGSIVTTIRRVSDNTPVAIGTTTYPKDGSVVYEEIVYQADGESIQRHTREVTTYPGDGSIKKEVEGIYD